MKGKLKSEMYDQLQKELYPHTIYITPLIVFSDVVQQIKEHRFNYPFYCKARYWDEGYFISEN